MSDETPAEPVFKPMDLKELMTNGVLTMANEQFFWPLGLALTWTFSDETGKASELHIRQWEYEDGHHEIITVPEAEMPGRRALFIQWLETRLTTLPKDERAMAQTILKEVRDAAVQ